MTSLPPKSTRAAALAAFLTVLAPRFARAEDSVSYKYQDYHELAGRISVEVHSAFVEKDLGTDMKLKLDGVIDTIVGATPTGQPAPIGSDQVPLAKLSERRKAWSGEFSKQFPRTNLALGVGNSRESDYVSTGWSVNTVTDFNQKNTNLLFGVAGTDDDFRVFYQTARAKKRTNDLILGVTQLLDPQTSVTVNATWGRQRGYLSDPYKLVQRDTEIVPGVFLPLTFAENRPGEREKWILLSSINRTFPKAGGALEASYRLYRDTYETTAHTVDLAWFQRVGERLILKPSIRFYNQSAAEFYHYRLDATSIRPTGDTQPDGPFYSSDYRLSEMQTVTLGFKAIWDVTAWLHLDAAIERYDMRGKDGVTPQSAYVRANIVTLGAKFLW